MGDDQSSSPLQRRVPGATRAAPGEAESPVLPEALLQRMQAAVKAAHAQAAEEHEATDEHRREQSAMPSQAAAKPVRSLPRRNRATSNGRRLPPGSVPTMRPPSSPVGWSNADDDTSEIMLVVARVKEDEAPFDGPVAPWSLVHQDA